MWKILVFSKLLLRTCATLCAHSLFLLLGLFFLLSDVGRSFASDQSVCVQSILSSLLPERQSNQRPHPDAVNFLSIKKGDSFYVTPDALRELPSVKNKLKDPVKVTVADVRIFNKGARKRAWKNEGHIIYIENPTIGRVAIPSWQLIGNAFSRQNFQMHAPFVWGEYVRIGSDLSDRLVVHLTGNPASTVTLDSGAAPYIGKFSHVSPDGKNYAVEIKSANNGINSLLVDVPVNEVYGLAAGTQAAVKQTLHKLLHTKLEFQTGEIVRYRDSRGQMQWGTYVRNRSSARQIRTSSGKSVYISENEVFKKSGNYAPLTPMYNADWIQAEFRDPQGLLADFLNGAAKLSSQPAFVQLPAVEKIRLLLKYTQRNIPWTKAARSAENAGLNTFNELICAGAGVCRHNSTLLATTLSEAGYPTRLVKYIHPGAKEGHAWFEVDMRLDNGKTETFVVDPSNGEFIEPYWKVKKLAKDQPNSFSKIFYTQPDRGFLLPQEP